MGLLLLNISDVNCSRYKIAFDSFLYIHFGHPEPCKCVYGTWLKYP